MKRGRKTILTLFLCVALLLSMFAGCTTTEEPPEDAVAKGVTSSLETVPQDAEAFETVLTLSGGEWKENISAAQIQLTGAFSDMTVKTLERLDAGQVKLVAEGTIDQAQGDGGICVLTDGVVDLVAPPEPEGVTPEESTQELSPEEPVFASAYIPVQRPRVEVTVEAAGGEKAQILLTLEADTFAQTLTPELFTLQGEGELPQVSSVERTGEDTCVLTFAGTPDQVFSQLQQSVLVIAGAALTSGKDLETGLAVQDAQLSATVDFVEEGEEGFLATVFLDVSNGTLHDLGETDILPGGEIVRVESVSKESDRRLVLEVLVSQAGAELDTLSFDGTLSIPGQWGTTLWGTERENILVDVHYDASAGEKELLAVETSLVYDLLKTGVKSLASSIGQKGGARLMEAINSDMFGDKTAQELVQLNTYLQQMDAKWSGALSQLNAHVAILADKIGQSNCSRILDEYDTLANRLKATVLHLEKKKEEVDAAKPGTPEYEAAAQAYVTAVDRESCKIYSDAYVLGQKILSGSAGLSSGVVGSYDEMLSLIYNFDVQTYDLKEEFRVLTLSLYLAAYDQAVLYYQITEPDNRLLTELQNQMVSVSQLIDQMDVERRTDENAFCYAAGKTVQLFVSWIGGNGTNSQFNAITSEIAAQMIARAEYRGTTLGADLDAAGFYSVTDKSSYTGGSSILLVDIVQSSNLTSKKREWWTTMTKINVKTHAIEKNVRTYYQCQKKNVWNIFTDDWKQTECWGVYDSQGLMLQGAK